MSLTDLFNQNKLRVGQYFMQEDTTYDEKEVVQICKIDYIGFYVLQVFDTEEFEAGRVYGPYSPGGWFHYKLITEEELICIKAQLL